MILRYLIVVEHLPLALVNGWVFYVNEPNIWFLIVALAFGWLVDIDHFFDYFYWLKNSHTKFSLNAFLKGKYFNKCRKVYLIFHAWEWVILLLVSSFILEERSTVLLCAGLGLFAHLIQDQITNKPSYIGYSILFRIFSSFSLDAFCKR
jgi:hypothetical protein